MKEISERGVVPMMDTVTLTDEEVARRVQAGDAEAFSIIVDRYTDKLLRYGRRVLRNVDDVEDCVQETFIKAYTSMQSFDVTRKFSPWIYRIAHNAFVSRIRESVRFPTITLDLDTLFPHPIAPETADRTAFRRELEEVVGASLQKLAAKYREPLVLYYYDELSYQEIADVLHIPIATVGVRISRAKKLLATQHIL